MHEENIKYSRNEISGDSLIK